MNFIKITNQEDNLKKERRRKIDLKYAEKKKKMIEKKRLEEYLNRHNIGNYERKPKYTKEEVIEKLNELNLLIEMIY